MKAVAVAAVAAVLAGCASMVRQSDLDAWAGAPVEALDTHSLFLTMPMVRTVTPSGVEVRNYVNKAAIGSCFNAGSMSGNSTLTYASWGQFSTCSSRMAGCDNIFYIRDGKVVEYAPTGRCITDERVRPQERYLRLVRP